MSKAADPSIIAPLVNEEERLLACVHCGFCLSACPTYTRLGDEGDSPRGRLYLMRAVAEGRLAPDAEAFESHIDRCLGCRACETVCPSGVQYGYLLERARDVIARSNGQSAPTRVLLGTYSSSVLTRIAHALARIGRWTRLPRLVATVLPDRFGRLRFGAAMLAATAPWKGVRALPAGVTSGRAVAPESTTTTVGEFGGAARALSPASRRSLEHADERPAEAARVAILTGCVQQGLYARVNDATVRVLAANGFDVVRVQAQVCCGALHAHAGSLEEARALARANIDAFMAASPDYIAVNSAGCGSFMKEYAELLADDAEYHARAEAFAGRVRDISELLMHAGVRAGAPVRARVTYDAPCHLYHGQGITRAPIELLRAIPELELVPLPGADECCGGAGIYGLLHPDLGGRVLRDKIRAVQSTGADIVVTPNPGCMMQIGAGLLLHGGTTRVLHPIELLDESYRRAGYYGRT